MCAVISPLKDIDISDLNSNFDSELTYNEFKTAEFGNVSSEYIESKITDATKELLKDEGISAEEISVEINISERTGIDINKFVLNFDYLDNPFEIEEKIYKKIGMKPEIILSGES